MHHKSSTGREIHTHTLALTSSAGATRRDPTLLLLFVYIYSLYGGLVLLLVLSLSRCYTLPSPCLPPPPSLPFTSERGCNRCWFCRWRLLPADTRAAPALCIIRLRLGKRDTHRVPRVRVYILNAAKKTKTKLPAIYRFQGLFYILVYNNAHFPLSLSLQTACFMYIYIYMLMKSASSILLPAKFHLTLPN